MRVFCPVVESLVPSMLGVGQPSKRGPIAGQLVGDHYPWLAPRRCEHTPQEPFGGVLIAPLLYQDVQHYAMFVDVPPQPMALSFDLQQHLVEMPLVTRAWPSATQLEGVGRSGLGAPLANRLVADGHTPFGQELLYVAQAEREAEVEPDSVADDVGRIAMATIQRGVGLGRSGHYPVLRDVSS